MARKLLVTMIIFVAVSLVVGYFIHAGWHQGSVNRSIQIKGVFSLVDEAGLLERFAKLSKDNPDRGDFLSQVRLMLGREPYVFSSSVRYSWPNKVIIEILEVTPVAIVNKRKLLLKDCQIIDVSPIDLHTGMIEFYVTDGELDDLQCRYIVELVPILESMSVQHVTMLHNHDYMLDLGDSRLVMSKDNIIGSVKRVRRMVDLVRAKKINASYIDMRYAAGASIRRVAEL